MNIAAPKGRSRSHYAPVVRGAVPPTPGDGSFRNLSSFRVELECSNLDAVPDRVVRADETKGGRMGRIVAALATLALLAGCTAGVRPQPTEIETSGVIVTLGGGGEPGTFCPPGQAKKGRC